MPLATKEAQREYQRLWIKKRRDEWMSANGPCKSCGSAEDLEVDHIDRSTKKMNPRAIWSRSKEVRESELLKCQVLCKRCHREKTKGETVLRPCGTRAAYRRGCRCDLCKKRAVQEVSEWRWNTGRRNKK